MSRNFYILFLLIFSCGQDVELNTPLFLLTDQSSGIHFENILTYDEEFNPYVYRNFYNGGGVAIGDINNDGLEDIYFTGNMVDNKLFLNKGNWEFEDITSSAGVTCPNIWSTGATLVDINGDGLLDIYVCKSGPPGGENRHNELFINNGDLTFTESSKEYGLDIEGLSVQAAFFDYDKDGDLDAYVLNNSIRSIGGYDLIEDQRLIPDPAGEGNKLLQNNNGYFKNVTTESGIYSSKIGFGLGITLGDYNNDNWTDIFVSNDFFEKDYLYINQQNGLFKEDLESFFSSISMGSMGADLADVDNDLNYDLIVTEMLPATLERQKTKTIFESWDKNQLAFNKGYYNQFSRNTFQRNLGDGKFIEVGRQSNVSATEWSWSALLFDMNNDGAKDIFISNGIYKDLLDRDYLTYEANDNTIKNRIQNKEKEVVKKLIDAMPSKAVPNAVFKNSGKFNFTNVAEDWGLDQPSFSNGAAYGDLDNDGDLDLVVNNVNMPSFVYKNTTDTLNKRSITLKFQQNNKNTFGIGSKVVIKVMDKYISAENYISRGFQSSVSSSLVIGVGDHKVVDSLWITWPDGATSLKTNLETNKSHILNSEDRPTNDLAFNSNLTSTKVFTKQSPLFEFEHKENAFIDFNNERLLPHMVSNEGPALANYDLNDDGIDDVFIGGAKYQSGVLYMSSENGYISIKTPFESDKGAEDVDALFFDADNDGDADLYVCHGGKAFSPYSIELNDALYINNKGVFEKSVEGLSFANPMSSSVVTATDFDNDGDIDLFVGERFKTNIYGQPGSGYILQNDGYGKFTPQIIKDLENLGMITDAGWTDIDNNGYKDLVIVGEWMSVKILLNNNGTLNDASSRLGLDDTSGLWSSLHLVDIDGDGDDDIIAGNIGLNNFFEPNMKIYVSDFDGNGFMEQIICKKVSDAYFPIVDRDELISQIPSLKKKLFYYKDYAKANINNILDKETLNLAYQSEINLLKSSVFVNEDGTFKIKSLPEEIQYAPIYAITSTDVDNDGNMDLLFGGNQYMVKPQFGRYDGSYGWLLKGSGTSTIFDEQPSSLSIMGQIRNLEYLNYNDKKILLVAKNNEKADFYVFEEE